jgi:hypothetical protein
MCTIIKVNQHHWNDITDSQINWDIETLQEFVDFFKTDPLEYIAFGYVTLDFNTCLCQIDLHKWFEKLNRLLLEKEIYWEFTGMAWQIKNL